MEKEILLKVNDMCKTFGPTKAVDHVSMDIYPGEIRGLIGENGSGKSTLTSMISGYLSKDSGTMQFAGAPYEPANMTQAIAAGISMIVQESGTIDGLNVAQNIFLGNEGEFYSRGICNRKRMMQKARELLNQYKLSHIDPAEEVSRYDFEERKMLELLKAMYSSPKLLIVDETTTALSHKGRDVLYQMIADIKRRGGSVIFISHDLGEVLKLCDHITVFRDGHYVDTVSNDKDLDEDALKRLMIGRELEGKYYRDDYGTPISDEVVLQAQDLCLDNRLEHISLELHRGEILGLAGLSECGMHELAKILFGACRPDNGSVRLLPKGREITSIQSAVSNDIAYVAKNRDRESLMSTARIIDNISIVNMDKFRMGFFLSPKKEYRFADEQAKKIHVKMVNVKQNISDLSGGNKQKVALVKWIARDARILILDCPTRGIDIKVKADIYELMRSLKEEGKSIIIISEELLEVIGMSDRILVMKNGRISGTLERREDLSEEDIIKLMI